MPKAFEACVKKGGRVITINPKKGKYLHVCYIGGKSYSGEVHTSKKNNPGNPYTKALAGTPEGYAAGLWGQKIRSGGKGRGLGRGRGRGPIGVPFNA